MSGNEGRETSPPSAGAPLGNSRSDDVVRTGCPPLDSWHDLLSDRTDPHDRDSLERHLEECSHCLDTLAVLAGGDTKTGDSAQGLPPAVMEALPASSRELLERLAQPQTFRKELAEVARAQPIPQIEGLDDLTEVGRGGAGVVYRARQRATNRLVAVKLLSLGPSRQGSARILREAELLGRLRHPHVVTIHASGVSAGSPYLLMEWLSGGTLQQQIERGEVAIVQAVRWTIELTQAIAAAHALGIIHRDLKPTNVLLEPAAEPGEPAMVKLTDFGLAADQASDQSLTVSGQVLGTPHYMAPEQTGLLPNLGEPGPACDVYGLGAILFALLAGRPPHGGDSTSQTLLRVSEQEPPSVSRHRAEVPFDLATIVAKCLRQHPAERYASARELAEDLQRFVSGRPILARPYSLTEQIAKWMRRRPMSAVALVLGCALIGGSVWSDLNFRILDRKVHMLNVEIKDLDGQRSQALRALQVTQDAQRSADEQLATVTSQLKLSQQQFDESRQQLAKATSQLQQSQEQVEVSKQQLELTERTQAQIAERLQKQIRSFHDHVFQQQAMLLRADVPYDKEGRIQLESFCRMCEFDVQQGLYRNLNNIDLTLNLAKLLLDLAHFWERQKENKQAYADFPNALDEALRCTDLVAEVTADKLSLPNGVSMHLEAKARWLRYTQPSLFNAPPNEVQRDRACELGGALASVDGRATVMLDPKLTTNCLMMIGWGVSHEEAQRLAQDLTDKVATLIIRPQDQADIVAEPGLRALWLNRLGTQVVLELGKNSQETKRLIGEMRRVAGEGRTRPKFFYEWYLATRLDTLRHWCGDAQDNRDEGAVLDRLPIWRECFEEISWVGEVSLNDHIAVAGRLVPLEAKLLQRRGEWTAARELLVWLQKVADGQAPADLKPSFPWEQFQARARIAMARLDLAQGRRNDAQQSLSEALDRLSRWLTDPATAQAAYEDWFDARLTIVESRGPDVPFEILHRELLDLHPHCPNQNRSRNRYARKLFETALRAGQTTAARKALTIIQDERRPDPEVGEECTGENLRKCLESILEAADSPAI